MTDLTLVIDDAVPYAQEIFGHLGTIKLMPGRDITNNDVANADALVIRSRTQVNETLIENSKVQFIGSTVVGLDHVNQPLLKEKGIHFYSAQGCNANSVAEFIVKAMYEMAEKHQFTLKDKTLGIIGVGNVGRRLAEKAKAIGMNILLNDPPRAETENAHIYKNGEQQAFSDLTETLSADIISVHTPLNRTGKHPTLNLLDAEKLRLLNPSQILINAARGDIIDESAWKQTTLLAKIVDCWSNEPHIDTELLQQADIATPHIAGHTFEAKLNGSVMVYEALCHFFNITPQYQWKELIPHPTKTLALKKYPNPQTSILSLLRNTHDIRDDMPCLSSNIFNKLDKEFEYYRRNYPIHHEFSQHTVEQNPDQNLTNLLKNLEFKVL